MNWDFKTDKEVSWSGYCQWLQGKTVREEGAGPYGGTIIEFTDGTACFIRSAMTGGGDETPADLDTPTVYVRDPLLAPDPEVPPMRYLLPLPTPTRCVQTIKRTDMPGVWGFRQCTLAHNHDGPHA